MILSKFLKAKREENFISINQLAKMINVNPSTISRFENGETEVKSIDLVKNIFNALNIDKKYIVEYFTDENECETPYSEAFKIEDRAFSKSDMCFICSNRYDLKEVIIGKNKPLPSSMVLCRTCRENFAKELFISYK